MRTDQANDYRSALIDLTALAQYDLKQLLELAEQYPDEYRKVVTELYPELVNGYRGTAEDLAVAVLNDHAPMVSAASSAPLTQEVYAPAIGYAIAADAPTLRVLGGIMQKHIFDAARETVTDSIETYTGHTDVRWARHASPTACGFCRLMATRGAVYTSPESAGTVVGRGKEMNLIEELWRGGKRGRIKGPEGSRYIAGGIHARGNRPLGETYHDHCRCTAVPSTHFDPYEPPGYVEDWVHAYKEIAKQAPEMGSHEMLLHLSNELRLI